MSIYSRSKSHTDRGPQSMLQKILTQLPRERQKCISSQTRNPKSSQLIIKSKTGRSRGIGNNISGGCNGYREIGQNVLTFTGRESNLIKKQFMFGSMQGIFHQITHPSTNKSTEKELKTPPPIKMREGRGDEEGAMMTSVSGISPSEFNLSKELPVPDRAQPMGTAEMYGRIYENMRRGGLREGLRIVRSPNAPTGGEELGTGAEEGELKGINSSGSMPTMGQPTRPTRVAESAREHRCIHSGSKLAYSEGSFKSFKSVESPHPPRLPLKSIRPYSPQASRNADMQCEKPLHEATPNPPPVPNKVQEDEDPLPPSDDEEKEGETLQLSASPHFVRTPIPDTSTEVIINVETKSRTGGKLCNSVENGPRKVTLEDLEGFTYPQLKRVIHNDRMLNADLRRKLRVKQREIDHLHADKQLLDKEFADNNKLKQKVYIIYIYIYRMRNI